MGGYFLLGWLGWIGISAFDVREMGMGFLCGLDWVAWDDLVGSSSYEQLSVDRVVGSVNTCVQL